MISPLAPLIICALFEQYFDNGQLQHVGHQKNGKSFGIWRHYRRDGELYAVIKKHKGIDVGLRADYEENLIEFIL